MESEVISPSISRSATERPVTGAGVGRAASGVAVGVVAAGAGITMGAAAVGLGTGAGGVAGAGCAARNAGATKITAEINHRGSIRRCTRTLRLATLSGSTA